MSVIKLVYDVKLRIFFQINIFNKNWKSLKFYKFVILQKILVKIVIFQKLLFLAKV